ncbi:MAG: hypothetical protein ABSE77_14355 [Acidimicrobiales bacterium]
MVGHFRSAEASDSQQSDSYRAYEELHGQLEARARTFAQILGLMDSTYNDRDHRQRRARAELARVDRDLKKLRAEIVALEEHRTKLVADLGA